MSYDLWLEIATVVLNAVRSGPMGPPRREGMDVDDREFLAGVLDQLTDGVYFVDRRRQITYWNEGAAALSGFARDEVVGRRCRDGILNHVDADGVELCGARCPLLATMHDGQRREARVFMHHKEGHLQPVLVRAAPLRDASGAIVGAVETFCDDSEYLATQHRLKEVEALSLQDPLTGLGNRRFLQRCLERRLLDWERHQVPFGVLIGDVDHFKRINDTYGHDEGDHVLSVLAATLLGATRGDDVVTRFGGEEFVVVCDVASTSDLRAVGDRARCLVEAARVLTPDPGAHVTLSFGGAMVHEGDDVTDLLHRADQYLLRAKASGRNRVLAADDPCLSPSSGGAEVTVSLRS